MTESGTPSAIQITDDGTYVCIDLFELPDMELIHSMHFRPEHAYVIAQKITRAAIRVEEGEAA